MNVSFPQILERNGQETKRVRERTSGQASEQVNKQESEQADSDQASDERASKQR